MQIIGENNDNLEDALIIHHSHQEEDEYRNIGELEYVASDSDNNAASKDANMGGV